MSELYTEPFDIADYLDDEETIAEYLTAAMEDPNPDVFLAALQDVAKARGMAAVAKQAGLGRGSLYKALKPGARPGFATITKVVRALGVTPGFTPPQKAAEKDRDAVLPV